MKRRMAMAAVTVLVCAGIAVWLARRRPAAPAPVVAVAPGAEAVDVVLCYPSRTGFDLVEETRRLPKPATAQDRLVQLVAELHASPASGAALPVFAPGSTPRAVYLAPDGVAYLDEPSAALDRQVGPRDETLIVRAVLRSIALGCPEVKAVVFLADGAARPRLCLHLPAHGRYLVPKLVPARQP